MSQDDLIDSDALERLVKTAEMKDADAVIPDMEWFFDGGKENQRTLPTNNLNYYSVID